MGAWSQACTVRGGGEPAPCTRPLVLASAVAPQLEAAWQLSTGQGAGLALAVQVGFVVGAPVSAMANIADSVPPQTVRYLGFGGCGGQGRPAVQ